MYNRSQPTHPARFRNGFQIPESVSHGVATQRYANGSRFDDHDENDTFVRSRSTVLGPSGNSPPFDSTKP
ncbi:hypothetical protein ANTQUA_LOCUS1729 [Anthophora quadrimaculata]